MPTIFDTRKAAQVIGTCSDVVRGAHVLVGDVDLVESVSPDVATLVGYALEHVSDDLDAVQSELERAARP